MIEHVTDLGELMSLVDSTERVVVAFSAPGWCVPCRKLQPHFEAAAERIPDTTFVEVDIDKAPDIREAFDIMSVPLVVMFVGGNVSGEIKGRTLLQLQSEIPGH